MSGGQRQRLFIARELYKKPRLLILDEATSALDGESELAIQESIDALHGQVTVVVIAHRLATVAMADKILVLDRGRLVAEGTHHDLMSAGGWYASAFSAQQSTDGVASGRTTAAIG